MRLSSAASSTVNVHSTVSFASSTAPSESAPNGAAAVPPAPSPTVVLTEAVCVSDKSTSAKVIVPLSVKLLDVAVALVSVTAPASSVRLATIVGASFVPSSVTSMVRVSSPPESSETETS